MCNDWLRLDGRPTLSTLGLLAVHRVHHPRHLCAVRHHFFLKTSFLRASGYPLLCACSLGLHDVAQLAISWLRRSQASVLFPSLLSPLLLSFAGVAFPACHQELLCRVTPSFLSFVVCCCVLLCRNGWLRAWSVLPLKTTLRCLGKHAYTRTAS